MVLFVTNNGRKMSKSNGNVIDPLMLMDELGTDALRFTLLVGSTPGMDMNVSIKKVEANRNFANKLWNAGRLIIGSLSQAPQKASNKPDWTLSDAYILARHNELVRSVETLFQSYQFGEAGRQIYDFFWSEFADWYLEIAKLQLAEKSDRAYYTAECMVRVFDSILRMLHPFTPFVTEEIWGYLKLAAQQHSETLLPVDGKWTEALIISSWPQPLPEVGGEAQAIRDFQQIQEIVRSIRNLRAEKNVKASAKISAIFSGSTEMIELLRKQTGIIASLSSLNPTAITLVDSSRGAYLRPEGHIALVAGTVEIYLPMADLVDPQEEIARLEKDLDEVQNQIRRLEDLLEGPFAEKAPAHVVQKEREKLSAFQITAEKLKSQLKSLG